MYFKSYLDPADAQIMFFYAVGKVKIIADRPQ